MKKIIPLVAVVLLVAACAAPPPPRSEPPKPVVDKAGQTLNDGHNHALALATGLTGTQVAALLGPPDETSAGTYGSDTPQPWQGVAWTYKWKVNWLESHRLVVVFVDLPDSLLVNNWNWYDF